ncbi:hypothetical protein ACVWWM_003913 [Ewingella americana]
MSAPPMEETKCQPNAKAISVMISSENTCKPTLSVRTKVIISRKEITNAARFSLWRCGNAKGFEEMIPRSLPNATIEPVKVTAPMKMPKNTSVRWMFSITESMATAPWSR